jgi:hypothetical protein
MGIYNGWPIISVQIWMAMISVQVGENCPSFECVSSQNFEDKAA